MTEQEFSASPHTITCDTFWGSHGCDLPARHNPEQEHPIHECAVLEYDHDMNSTRGICSQAQYVDGFSIRQRFTTHEGGWTDWSEVELELFRLDTNPAR